MAIYKLQRIFSDLYFLQMKMFGAEAKLAAMLENASRLEKAGKTAEAATARAQHDAYKALTDKQKALGKEIAERKKVVNDTKNSIQNGDITGKRAIKEANKDINSTQNSINDLQQQIQQNRGSAVNSYKAPFDAATTSEIRPGRSMENLKGQVETYRTEKQGYINDELTRRGLKDNKQNVNKLGEEYKNIYRNSRDLNVQPPTNPNPIQNITQGQQFTYKTQPQPKTPTPNTTNTTTNTTTNSKIGDWWGKQSKTTQGLVIGGGALATGLGGGALISNMGNNNNQRAFSYKEYIKTLLK